MIKNSYVKKKFWAKMLYFVAAILCIFTAYFFLLKSADASAEAYENIVPFSEAYKKDMISDEYRRKNSYMVYVDIITEPVEFAYYEGKESYYLITDGERLYIMRAYDYELEALTEELKTRGQARVAGPVVDVDFKIMAIGYMEIAKVQDLTADEFHDYYQNVAVSLNANSEDADNYSFLSLLLVFAAILLIGLGISRISIFSSSVRKVSREERAYIERELADPGTILIKPCNILLTPNYLVAGKNFKAIPYGNIMWAHSDGKAIMIHTSANTVEKVGHKSRLVSGYDYYANQVFSVIYSHNPYTVFGYTKEAQDRFNSMMSGRG